MRVIPPTLFGSDYHIALKDSNGHNVTFAAVTMVNLMQSLGWLVSWFYAWPPPTSKVVNTRFNLLIL